MKKPHSQGFTIVEALIIIVVVVVIGAVGFVAYSKFVVDKSLNQANQPTKSESQLASQLDTKLQTAKELPKPAVKSKDDLQKGIDALNDTSKFDTSEQTKELNERADKFLN